MKVTHLVASVSRAGGGIFEIARRLAQELALQGTSTEVLGLRDAFTAQDLPSWMPLKPRVFTVTGPPSLGYAPGYAGSLAATQPDIGHLHSVWMYPARAAWKWSQRGGRPYVVTINGMLDAWAVNHARLKKRVVEGLYAQAALRHAACLQVNSLQELAAVRDYGLRNPACVISNGVDVPAPGTPPSPSPFGSFAQPGQKVLLYLGRLHPKKGLEHLVQAWADQRNANPSLSGAWRLAIAGWSQGGHEGDLKALAERLHVGPSVHFLGPRFNGDKRSCFQHADGFILPSFSEGFPMAVLEAWSHRLPVLMTPQCNLAEGFRAQAAIEILPDVESTSEGLLRLFAMPEQERTALGANGYRLVQENYTWPQVAGEMKGVYEWVLGGGPPPACVITD